MALQLSHVESKFFGFTACGELQCPVKLVRLCRSFLASVVLVVPY